MNAHVMPEAAAVARPPVLPLVVRTKMALYDAWMPLLKGGGLFLATDRPFALGEEVLILLTLPNEPAKIALQGKVAWINFANTTGNRPQGIGVQLAEGEVASELRRKVENALAGAMQSSRATHTI